MKRETRKATIRDVASAAGVGLQTVSRVLNGGRYVKPTTSARIQAAIKRLNYQPNEAARVLRGQRAKTIGLIIPDLADPFFSSCAHAIQQVATARDYMTFVLTSEWKPGLEGLEIRMMAERNVSGLLIIPSEGKSAPVMAEIMASGIPVVTLDRALDGVGCGEVAVDNFRAAKTAIEHLIGHGHQRILAMGYDSGAATVTQRIAGYSSAIADAGFKPDVLQCHSRDGVQLELLKRLDRKIAPTALFTLGDVVTIRALHALNSRNICIPDEIALIGFDDFELAPLLKVPVTAIRQSGDEMGRTAANLLFEQIQSGKPPSKLKVVLPTELIIRRSCGCNPS
jgi:LacI family transcriptional regulator